MNEPQSYAIIPLTQGKFAIVDPERYRALNHFYWRAVKAKSSWYAKADVWTGEKYIAISMHRFIAQTPFGQVTHHINHNTLDNRKANLQNMDKGSHTLYHRQNNILIKWDPNQFRKPPIFNEKSRRHPL